MWKGVAEGIRPKGDPAAMRRYVGSHALDDSERRRYVAVLRERLVDSPEAAVRAAIVQEQRGDE